MLNIGITGGIGVGKTTVCRIFETLDIPVYYSDYRAKRLMTGNKKVKAAIKALFGSEAYFKNGRLNRKHIGGKVFQDKSLLEALNAIVHPAVFADAVSWVQEQQAPYVLQEAALLVESGRYKMFDKLIVVSAPEAVKIERVRQRDRKSIAEVQAIIDKQMPDKLKIEKADFVIINDGKTALIPQVLAIHNILNTTT
jgi:dephospho-CoA kinase